ncbi:transcriptional regulator [Helicobacter turcicus]|uniref:Transcriptional regulator n=1 Tax=Helicobacter turcicus TaxID=2867412 RepID=A0ABS7JPC4_9HELI|nr:transcriptional regulator [Helicobacter turcicus]MBX7491259.1 transcriptional regulator [Helicobacter turcicus]MBX7546102.1 transcriptional regulator [Helicobacter turcicus]
MKYLLKNKDKVVLEFEVILKRFSVGDNYKEAKVINAIQIQREDNIPLQINKENLNSSLTSWIMNRKAPNNRTFIEKILSTLNKNKIEDFMDYIDISLGLSLNDSFWIIPSDKDYKWKDFNLYENEFSEALELVAFSGLSHKVSGLTSSPEYTTNGMLKKCWHREDNKIYLYKGNGDGFLRGGKEAYSEYYMAQIAEIMEFDFVPYDLKLFHNELASVCPIFTSENEGYMPIVVFISSDNRDKRGLELIENIIKIYPEHKFFDLMLFDALICNKDRHLGNFGMIVDNDTGKILRPAPIFDNGMGIINIPSFKELSQIEEIISERKSFFGFSFKEQLQLFAQQRHIPNLQKLSSFNFKRHEKYNLSEEWLAPIESHIQQRAKMALRFIEEKQEQLIQDSTKSKESQNQDSINLNIKKHKKHR